MCKPHAVRENRKLAIFGGQTTSTLITWCIRDKFLTISLLVVLDGYEKSLASVGTSLPFSNHLTFGAGDPGIDRKKTKR